MLDLSLQNTVEVKTTSQITTNKTRVKGVYFDFDNTQAIAFIAFGIDNAGVFEEKKSETWKLSGDFYLQAISGNTSNGTMAEELLAKVADVVSQIQGDQILKDNLIKSRELRIIGQDYSQVFVQV